MSSNLWVRVKVTEDRKAGQGRQGAVGIPRAIILVFAGSVAGLAVAKPSS